MTKTFTFTAQIVLFDGESAWHFVTVPPEISQEIEFYFAHVKKGWGSLPVTVHCQDATWKTSIFTDKKRNGFLLPFKAEIRKKTGLVAGDRQQFTLDLST